MNELTNSIERLLGDFSSLDPRIKHLSYKTEKCADRIDVRCSYISFRDGEITFDEFMTVLSDLIIPFCLPRSEISEATQKISSGDHIAAGRVMAQLSSKARDLFMRAKKGSHRSGEAGEILLYLLNEWVLKAPQIVSKMYLKTNNNMPVHGTDGIHARFDQKKNKLIIYWGESKCHATIPSGLTDALKSIKEFVDDGHENREIQIITDHMDLGSQSSAAKDAILDYLDPYSSSSDDRMTVFSCLLVFNAPDISASDVDPEEVEKLFVEEVNGAVEDFIDGVRSKVTSVGLGTKRFEFFLVPVPAVQGFRDMFQSKIGWPND